MVEEMLAARGISVTHETIRQWGLKFGREFAGRIRRRAPLRGDKWHLDEVVIGIAGKKHWLWRAVDQDGFVLDILVQSRRDKKAAKRLFRKLLKKQGRAPRVLITDKLRSYGRFNASFPPMTRWPTFSSAAETTTPPQTSGPAAPRPSPPGPTSPALPWLHNARIAGASLCPSRASSIGTCQVDGAFQGHPCGPEWRVGSVMRRALRWRSHPGSDAVHGALGPGRSGRHLDRRDDRRRHPGDHGKPRPGF